MVTEDFGDTFLESVPEYAWVRKWIRHHLLQQTSVYGIEYSSLQTR